MHHPARAGGVDGPWTQRGRWDRRSRRDGDSAAEREGRSDARSTAGDLDLTIYSLRKWTRLALKGNPTILLLLFTPPDQLVCCVQGVEPLTTGRVSLPMRDPERAFLLDVRRGQVSEQDCLTRAGELERELADLSQASPLPEAPDEARVAEWVLKAYGQRWRIAGD